MTLEESRALRLLRACGAYATSTLLYLCSNNLLWYMLNVGFVEQFIAVKAWPGLANGIEHPFVLDI
jgi:hypothetical protein